jgi:hypothetical protein
VMASEVQIHQALLHDCEDDAQAPGLRRRPAPPSECKRRASAFARQAIGKSENDAGCVT